jgi:hypothetical protein
MQAVLTDKNKTKQNVTGLLAMSWLHIEHIQTRVVTKEKSLGRTDHHKVQTLV